MRTFETLFPTLRGGKLLLKEKSLSNFPFWVKTAARAHTLQIPGPGAEPLDVTLIEPNTQLSFDQLLNVYRQIAQKTGPRTLLIADSINPKHRPLLVKFGIEFVYRDESIFAPSLAMMFSRLHPYKQRQNMEGKTVAQELHPFSLKLLSAFLCRQLPKENSLQQLLRRPGQAEETVSLSKLSSAMNELVQLGFAETSGRGPKKTFIFFSTNAVWTHLSSASIAPFMKTVHQFNELPNKDYVWAGETALADYSDLAKPKTPTIAVSTKVHRQMKGMKAETSNLSETGVYVQIWKENPKVFSIKGKLNPIELYLSMREHPDERVQLAMKTMLGEYDL